MSDSQQNITDLLKKNYFWDVDVTSGKKNSDRIIVERIFNFGTLREIGLVIRFYGRKEVERILLSLNFLDPRTLNFVSKFFNLQKRDFKCYKRKQLTVQHWDY